MTRVHVFAVARVQAGQVLAHAQPADLHHGPHHGRPGKPHHRPLHYHIHIRRHGHAALRQELLRCGHYPLHQPADTNQPTN